MKRHKVDEPFIKQLKRVVHGLRKIGPSEVHILSIDTNYGHYQLIIGSGHAHGLSKGSKGTSIPQRAKANPIEINGEIHHLFVSPRSVRVQPSRHQISNNLRGTVIMQGLNVHLKDPKGDGQHLAIPKGGERGIHARENINLAGRAGERLVKGAQRNRYLPMATYRIIQRDILRTLKRH